MKFSSKERQEIICKMIKDPSSIDGSTDIVLELKDKFKVSVSTIYREFKKLGIKKNSIGNYQLSIVTMAEENRRKLAVFLQEYGVPKVLNADVLPLKTARGTAPFIAQQIEEAFPNEVSGTITGDDLILLLVRAKDIKNKKKIMDFFNSISLSGATSKKG